MNDEFFIGWKPAIPKGFAQQVKRSAIVLITIVVLIASLLALLQKKFGSGNFEFGKLTEVKGIFFNEPVPNLKAVNGRDLFGNPSFITIPLIGFGKLGAAGALDEIQQQQGISLNRKEVTMKGTLLYNDGKLLMQIDANDSLLVKVNGDVDSSRLPVAKELGESKLRGEIVDPKCFFGVMKPGQGKPHKDCAIRCILGGIPPVLKVTDDKGNQNYYLIAGRNGEKMSGVVKDFVGEPVTIYARVVKYDDWIILYLKENAIARYSYIEEHFKDKIASCGTASMR